MLVTYARHESKSQKIPKATEDGMMISRPAIMHRKKEPISIQSTLLKCGLLSKETTTKTNSGPQAIHSPHIAEGDATLKEK